MTLTFDPRKMAEPGSSTHTAVGWSQSARFWDEWLARVAGDSTGTGVLPGLPHWVRGREPNPYRYGTHFHALVGGLPPDLSRSGAWSDWFTRHGMARIEPYNPEWGAGRYLSKYVVKELGDITFSDNLADRMKEGTIFDG